jgi:hypothetical protein
MLNIRIQTQFLWLFKKEITTTFPEIWNELSYNMIKGSIDFLSLLFFANTKKKDFDALVDETIYQRLLLIYPFLDIKYNRLFKLNTYQIDALLKRTTFIINGDRLLNKILVNDFRLRGKKYHGPNDRLSNLKFGEFIQADTYFMAYEDTDNDDLKYNLIACLYRPVKRNINTDSPDFDGDVRELFNQYHIKQRANQFKRLPKELVDAILFNYKTIRKWLTERYIYVFGNYDNAQSNNDMTFKDYNKNEGWKGIIKNMASSVLEIEKYAEQNMHNVLDDLDDKILSNLKD